MSGAAAKQETLPYYIRRATKDDSSALSYICLATADAGKSAEKLHTAGELPGLVYAEPYVHLPTGFGFVLVDPSRGENGEAVGYVLATSRSTHWPLPTRTLQRRCPHIFESSRSRTEDSSVSSTTRMSHQPLASASAPPIFTLTFSPTTSVKGGEQR